jgi:hypothetical protein
VITVTGKAFYDIGHGSRGSFKPSHLKITPCGRFIL